jgi:hypothetical protein
MDWMRRHGVPLCVLGAVAAGGRAGGESAAPLPDAARAAGVAGGLAVHVGDADGGLASDLAAPYDRKIVSHGQLESSWPVYNVVLHEGKACFTAGLHPETGGGIAAWGLEPRTGAVAWRKTFKRAEIAGKSKVVIAPNRVLNRPLASDGKSLSIVGLSFEPGESDAEIQKRIDEGSRGDRNRNTGWTPRGTEPKRK